VHPRAGCTHSAKKHFKITKNDKEILAENQKNAGGEEPFLL
jgi:hypothetical protein